MEAEARVRRPAMDRDAASNGRRRALMFVLGGRERVRSNRRRRGETDSGTSPTLLLATAQVDSALLSLADYFFADEASGSDSPKGGGSISKIISTCNLQGGSKKRSFETSRLRDVSATARSRDAVIGLLT